MSDLFNTTCKRCDQEFKVSWTTGLATQRAFIPRHKARCDNWCMPKAEGGKWGMKVHYSIASCDRCKELMDDKRSEKEKLAGFGITIDDTPKPAAPSPPPRPPGRPPGTGGAPTTIRIAPQAARGTGQVSNGGFGAVDQSRRDSERPSPPMRTMRDADAGSQSRGKMKDKWVDQDLVAAYLKTIDSCAPLMVKPPTAVTMENVARANKLIALALDRLAAIFE